MRWSDVDVDVIEAAALAGARVTAGALASGLGLSPKAPIGDGESCGDDARVDGAGITVTTAAGVGERCRWLGEGEGDGAGSG